MQYKYYEYTFSDKEIEQICELVKRWSCGDIWRPIDARHYTKQVKEWALNVWSTNLLEKRDNRLYITSSSSYNNASGSVFVPRWNLPVEVLWRLVRPMLREDGATGYNIVNNKMWMSHLGIAPQNDRYANDRELKEKEDILLLLDQHHYIIFQMAGSVWSIYQEQKVA